MLGNIIDYLTDYVDDLERSKKEMEMKAVHEPIEMGNHTREIITINIIETFITGMHKRIHQLTEAEKYNSDRHNTDYGAGFPSQK